jgi:hypothetical protein
MKIHLVTLFIPNMFTKEMSHSDNVYLQRCSGYNQDRFKQRKEEDARFCRFHRGKITIFSGSKVLRTLIKSKEYKVWQE